MTRLASAHDRAIRIGCYGCQSQFRAHGERLRQNFRPQET